MQETIKTIQKNALTPTQPNGVSKTLTYQQAYSVFLRSNQLEKEGVKFGVLDAKEKAWQINECYIQRRDN